MWMGGRVRATSLSVSTRKQSFLSFPGARAARAETFYLGKCMNGMLSRGSPGYQPKFHLGFSAGTCECPQSLVLWPGFTVPLLLAAGGPPHSGCPSCPWCGTSGKFPFGISLFCTMGW